MVFYGPSGVGKTTVASIIAKQSHMHLCKLNGTTASTADIRDVVAQVNYVASGKAAFCCALMRSGISTKAAANALGVHRKRQHHADRFHNGKPLFFTYITPF